MSYYVDTNVFLNVIYKETVLNERSSVFLKKIHAGKLHAMTSSVTLMEIILDMAESGFSEIIEVAVASIEDLHNLEIVPLDRSMTKLAADHVIKEKLTIHDAYHLATATSKKARVFVTRDEQLSRKIARYMKATVPEEAES
jgi:predicted nucleic acid-binding protein